MAMNPINPKKETILRNSFRILLLIGTLLTFFETMGTADEMGPPLGPEEQKQNEKPAPGSEKKTGDTPSVPVPTKKDSDVRMTDLTFLADDSSLKLELVPPKKEPAANPKNIFVTSVSLRVAPVRTEGSTSTTTDTSISLMTQPPQKPNESGPPPTGTDPRLRMYNTYKSLLVSPKLSYENPALNGSAFDPASLGYHLYDQGLLGPKQDELAEFLNLSKDSPLMEFINRGFKLRQKISDIPLTTGVSGYIKVKGLREFRIGIRY